jgi:hypothetical protein
MSSFAVARNAVAAAIGLMAFGLTTQAGQPAPALPVRPAVALKLSIDADHYRKMLRDEPCARQCLALRDALADSVRSLLQSSYAFLDWSAGPAAARDTVEIRWIERPPLDIPGSKLDFRIRSPEPRMRLSSFPVEFETYADFSARESAPEKWHPDSLRRAWLTRLASTLRQPELLVEVFGRIPLNAPVAFLTTGRATVGVRAQDIGVDARNAPVFLVRATVTDPRHGTVADADVVLVNCLTMGGSAAFNCEPTQLIYSSHSLTGTELTQLLARATLVKKTVGIVEYVTPGRPPRFNGAVLPEGLP